MEVSAGICLSRLRSCSKQFLFLAAKLANFIAQPQQFGRFRRRQVGSL